MIMIILKEFLFSICFNSLSSNVNLSIDIFVMSVRHVCEACILCVSVHFCEALLLKTETAECASCLFSLFDKSTTVYRIEYKI